MSALPSEQVSFDQADRKPKARTLAVCVWLCNVFWTKESLRTTLRDIFKLESGGQSVVFPLCKGPAHSGALGVELFATFHTKEVFLNSVTSPNRDSAVGGQEWTEVRISNVVAHIESMPARIACQRRDSSLVPDVGSFDEIEDFLADVRRMVGDALQGSRNENQTHALRTDGRICGWVLQ